MCLYKYARNLCIIQSFYDIIKSQHVYKYTECIFVVTLFCSLLSLCVSSILLHVVIVCSRCMVCNCVSVLSFLSVLEFWTGLLRLWKVIS